MKAILKMEFDLDDPHEHATMQATMNATRWANTMWSISERIAREMRGKTNERGDGECDLEYTIRVINEECERRGLIIGDVL